MDPSATRTREFLRYATFDDDDVRPGFGEVRVVVTVTGPETRERYLELHAAAEAHCPVLDLTRNPTPVVSVLETPETN